MSDPYGEGTTAKSDWAEEGIYIPHSDGGNAPQPFHPHHGPSTGQRQSPTSTVEERRFPDASKQEIYRGQPHGLHREGYEAGNIDFPHPRSPRQGPSSGGEPISYREYSAAEPFFRDRAAGHDNFGPLGEQSLLSPVTSSGQPANTPFSASRVETEEFSDDGDVADADNDNQQEQTAAERLAARRKMKRFRLTHHQTRFLMSEFAKQPHPDAAHRERLSREIPGLSPRQVQVWFQNRRAKIKRLNADDRERMMQMRAVPDDFDNVQALHSPYGAAHAYDTSLSSSAMAPHGQVFGQHGARSLMVDVRRPEGEQHLQSTGLTPVFSGVGFGHPHASSMLDASSMISSPPQPFGSADRYTYGGRLDMATAVEGKTDTEIAAGPGSEGDSSRVPGTRPLRPAAVPDSSVRARSGSLQSPMGPGMFWRAGLNETPPMQGGPRSVLNEDPQNSPLHTTPLRMESPAGGMSMSGAFYGDDGRRQQSNTDMTTLHQAQMRRSRAASATFPLDGRNQYAELNQPMELSIRTDNLRQGQGQSASHHPTSAYTPTYPVTPFSASSITYPTSATMGPRDNLPTYGFAGGDNTGSGLSTYTHSSQAAEAPGRSLFDSPAPMGFEQPEQSVRYGEGADTMGSVKREQ